MAHSCTHNHGVESKFTINRMRQYDPTGTTTLRDTFAREMRVRFERLRRLILQAVIVDDVFALGPPQSTGITALQSPGRRAYEFQTTSQKIDSFINWLNQEINNEVFSRRDRALLPVPTRNRLIPSDPERWSDVYIDSAYQKGIRDARQNLINQGLVQETQEIGRLREGAFTESFNTPIHIDRVRVLYTRTFETLKGVTADMSRDMSQILSQGLIEGRGPREVGRSLASMIDKKYKKGALDLVDSKGRFIPAKRRAQMIARTEIIRAHHLGGIQELKQFGIEKVDIKAEWITAGDDRVCPDCLDLEAGGPYPIKEVEGLLPLHPNCRCTVIPVRAEDTRPVRPAPTPPPAPSVAEQAVAADRTAKAYKPLLRGQEPTEKNIAKFQKKLNAVKSEAKELNDEVNAGVGRVRWKQIVKRSANLRIEANYYEEVIEDAVKLRKPLPDKVTAPPKTAYKKIEDTRLPNRVDRIKDGPAEIEQWVDDTIEAAVSYSNKLKAGRKGVYLDQNTHEVIGSNAARQIKAFKELRKKKGEYTPWLETKQAKEAIEKVVPRGRKSSGWVNTDSGEKLYGRGLNLIRNGDCVSRAVCNAGEGDYLDIWQAISRAKNPGNLADNGLPFHSTNQLAESLGFKYLEKQSASTISARYRVQDFVEFDTRGTGKEYFILTDSTPTGKSINHIIYVKDGMFFDKWDSGQQYVKYIYERDIT